MVSILPKRLNEAFIATLAMCKFYNFLIVVFITTIEFFLYLSVYPWTTAQLMIIIFQIYQNIVFS